MRVKTSITLSAATMRTLDQIGGKENRSRIIEAAILEYAASRARAAREAKDLEVLNRTANRLNEEIEDLLEFQAPL